MQTTTPRFNTVKVKKFIKTDEMLSRYYEWLRWGGASETQALRKTFEEIILTNNRYCTKYDNGETRKKLGRAPLLDIPLILDKEYNKNWKTVDKIVGRLGCNLTGFNPDWLIHYGQHSMDISYEVMRQLASLLGYKWIDKKQRAR